MGVLAFQQPHLLFDPLRLIRFPVDPAPGRFCSSTRSGLESFPADPAPGRLTTADLAPKPPAPG
ncbi:hypothetical protein ACSNN7_20860, partial [Micromonospora sp. URMC 105]|uniref:hypothetical protein n=1 Tax=Micromonospora sp. URMC 105 TaxID=3423413 RepID=UPI003F1D140A